MKNEHAYVRSSIYCIPEVDLCTLMLNNIEPSVTKEKVLNLSHHIIDARILDSSKEREGK